MQFDFGQNWAEFSKNVLTPEKVEQAKTNFADLVDGLELSGKSFLDIGFGQGLSLLSAVSMGANVVGCDINPKCTKVIEANAEFFPSVNISEIPMVVGSILDNSIVQKLDTLSPSGDGAYDLVHSWGVLHHTGNMKKAIENTASLVKPKGILILALYNRHWSSFAWLCIKWFYCKAPRFLQKTMIYFFYPIIWCAKLIVTGENPKKQSRGMDFFYNVVDWVGGYPYEYASMAGVEEMLSNLDCECVRKIKTDVPTGCNQFVFLKTS